MHYELQSINRASPTWIWHSLPPRAKLGRIYLILKENREQIKYRCPKWLIKGRNDDFAFHTGELTRTPEILEHHYLRVTQFQTVPPTSTASKDAPATQASSSLWEPRVTTSGYCFHVLVSACLGETQTRLHPYSFPPGLLSVGQCLSLLCPHQLVNKSSLWERARCTFHREPSGLLATTGISGYQVPSTMMPSMVPGVFHVWSECSVQGTMAVLISQRESYGLRCQATGSTDRARKAESKLQSQDFPPAEPRLCALGAVAFGIYSKSSHTLALKRSVLEGDWPRCFMAQWGVAQLEWNPSPLLSRWVWFLERDSKNYYWYCCCCWYSKGSSWKYTKHFHIYFHIWTSKSLEWCEPVTLYIFIHLLPSEPPCPFPSHPSSHHRVLGWAACVI